MSETPIDKLMRVFAVMDLAKGYDKAFTERMDAVGQDYAARLQFLESYIRKHHVALQLLTHAMDRQGMEAKKAGQPFPDDKRSDDFKSFEDFLYSQKGRED